MNTELEFWSYVDKGERENSQQCWVWTGAHHQRGYGRLRWRGSDVAAHRLAWELSTGAKIPSGLVVMHLCDNPACCRPQHLVVGTHAANQADKYLKRRGARPMSEELLREARGRVLAGETRKSVAESLGVGRVALGRALTGVSYLGSVEVLPKKSKWAAPPEVRAEAVRRVEAGESASAVAEELGVSRLTVWRWRRRVHVQHTQDTSSGHA